MKRRRVTVWFSEFEFAELEQFAGAAGVTVGGLVREAAVRFGLEVAGDASAGRVRMRRRSASSRPASAASDGRVARALEAREAVAERREGRPLVPEPASRAEMFRRALGPK